MVWKRSKTIALSTREGGIPTVNGESLKHLCKLVFKGGRPLPRFFIVFCIFLFYVLSPLGNGDIQHFSQVLSNLVSYHVNIDYFDNFFSYTCLCYVLMIFYHLLLLIYKTCLIENTSYWHQFLAP